MITFVRLWITIYLYKFGIKFAECISRTVYPKLEQKVLACIKVSSAFVVFVLGMSETTRLPLDWGIAIWTVVMK